MWRINTFCSICVSYFIVGVVHFLTIDDFFLFLLSTFSSQCATDQERPKGHCHGNGELQGAFMKHFVLAQPDKVCVQGERLLASASASSAAKARQRTASEGCSPQVEYILAYTDRMRQAAQQAIESCATSSSGSSSGGSGRKVPQERLSVTAPAKDDDSKPRRKLLFSGVANSDAPLLQ